MTRYSAMKYKMCFVVFVLFCAFGYVGVVLYRVQIFRHEELYAKARVKYTAQKTSRGTRGEIYDFHGSLLVGNIPAYNIVCDPSIVGNAEKCAEIAQFLVKRTGADYATVYRRLSDKTFERRHAETGEMEIVTRKYAELVKDVPLELGRAIREECAKQKYHGISFKETHKRNYPKNELLANVLGYTSGESATAGVEKAFDQSMQSGENTVLYERSRDGRVIFQEDLSFGTHAPNGASLYLTIQEPLQSILESELDNLMETTGSRAAYGVMVDPYTGDIMALAQRPTFNPNDRTTMNPDAYRNRLCGDVYEPGSIIKPLVMAGALDADVVRPDTMIDCEDRYWFYAGKRLQDSHTIGLVPAYEVIKQSSNIGIAKISLMMGKERLDKTLRSFGFGQRTGIPLKPETAGIFRPLNRWDSLSITRFCIGQGIAASALQMARAYCILANGGFPLKLRLVDRIDADGKVTKLPYEREEKSIFRKPETPKQVIRMMKMVPEPGGTALEAAVPCYYVAGKTGTAEKFFNGAYQKKYVASFCGFVPADNPRYVLIITCDEPQGQRYYGGQIAAPAFSRISEQALKYLRVQEEIDRETWDAERKSIRKSVWDRRQKAETERLRRRAEREARSR